MSALDKLQSFAEARSPDERPIRDGLTYGDARELLAHTEAARELIARLASALPGGADLAHLAQRFIAQPCATQVPTLDPINDRIADSVLAALEAVAPSGIDFFRLCGICSADLASRQATIVRIWGVISSLEDHDFVRSTQEQYARIYRITPGGKR